MFEQLEFWQAVSGIIIIVNVVVGGLVYSWKRKADADLEKVRQDAEETKTYGRQLDALVTTLTRIADSWSESDKRSAIERQTFADIVRTNADAKEKLAMEVHTQRASIDTTNEQIKALASGFEMGKQEVKSVVETGFEKQSQSLVEIITTLQGVRSELSNTQATTHASLARVETQLDGALALLKQPVTPELPALTEVKADAQAGADTTEGEAA